MFEIKIEQPGFHSLEKKNYMTELYNYKGELIYSMSNTRE